MTRSIAGVQVLCSVRGCGRTLQRRAREWECPNGHGFDVARSGYVNLLQPTDSRSRSPGDTPKAVSARARLEERGIGGELRDALASRAGGLVRGPGAPALDVGAGTGLLLGQLAQRHRLEAWALDISVPAVRLGARRWPGVSWIVANGDRALPFAGGAFDLILSSTGPKNPSEFHRVLAPGGALLLVVPAPDDLVELRRAVLGEGRLPDRTGRALELFGSLFDCVDRTSVRARRWLERADLDDLLAATYRGARRAQTGRLGDLVGLETTQAADVLQLVPRG